MKVLLINPPKTHLLKTNVPLFLEKNRGLLPPLGLLYVASWGQENSNADFFVLDAEAEELSHNQTTERAMEIGPDVVGIPATSFSLYDAILTSRNIKSRAPETVVAFGGPHPTIYPRETAALPEADYVIAGEGEIPFARLVDALAAGVEPAGIPGVCSKNDAPDFCAGRGELITDLDSIPIPDRTKIPCKKYRSIMIDGHMSIMISSRGCPYECSFCDRTIGGRAMRYRSPENVVEEMLACQALGVGEIIFYDDTFILKKSRALEMCELMMREKIRIKWHVSTRVNTVDDEILRAMKAAGCIRINFGVEAGDEIVLREMAKDATLPQIRKAFEATRRAGIQTLAFFMFGSPGEKEREIRKTMRLAKEIRPDYIHFSIATPYPNTPLYEKALREGVFGEDHWQAYAKSPSPDFRPPHWREHFSEAQMMKILHGAYRAYYLSPRQILRQARIAAAGGLPAWRRRVSMGLKILLAK